MPYVSWSKSALADLARLRSFLAARNREASLRAVLAIREAVKIARRNPEIGRPTEHADPRLRELVIPFGGSAYVARYIYDGRNRVIVVSVRHGREDQGGEDFDT